MARGHHVVAFLILLASCTADPFFNSPGVQELRMKQRERDIAETDAQPGESWHLPWRSHAPKEYSAQGKLFHQMFSPLDKFFAALRKNTGLKGWKPWKLPQVRSVMLEMRDGVKLATLVINPYPYHKKKGTLLSRSPYGPTSDQVADIFMAMNGYAAVIQDQRGTFRSQGNFSVWRKDGDDGYDTMKWIAQQPWSNGDVFSAGVSADGCGALTQLLDEPKWLKGQFIMLASADAHSTMYPGGAFREGLIEGWMGAMSVMTRGYSLLHTLPDIMKHEALSEWYDPIEATDKSFRVDYPTIHLASWWDIFQNEHIEAWNRLAVQSRISVRNNHTLFVSPLGHCALGDILDPFVLEHELPGWLGAFQFAAEEFRGDARGPAHKRFKRVNFFVQGPRHERWWDTRKSHYWVAFDDWPQVAPQRYYLSGENDLVGDFNLVVKGSRSFIYDPSHPAKTKGGNNLILAMLGHGCGSVDQTVVEKRNDVLVFTTREPLRKPLAITGKLRAELYVSSDRNDTDFVVSLTDVHPDGKSMQVRYGVRRMKWRFLAKEAAPIDRKIIYRIEVDLWFSSYVFLEGHKIRFTVTSSSAPYIKPNNNFNSNVLLHRKGEGLKANNTVFFSPYDYPSFVELPIVKLEDLEGARVRHT